VNSPSRDSFYANPDVVNSILDAVRDAAANSGLNLVAATPAARYDAAVKLEYQAGVIAPGAQSIVVIGNGGGAFWKAFKRHADDNPAWMARDNPLDDFTRVIVEREIAPVLERFAIAPTIIYPFISNAPTLNFMEAGKASGLSGPSILGVMVHPVYGPWIAFRAAILVNELLDAPGEAYRFDPCPSCIPRTCISACPADAVSIVKGWDIPKCLTHRVEVEADCAPRCHARAECVLGPEHRYPDDELAYHQMRALRAMRPYYETHIKPGRRV
jgi:epoxyqueuosine reductase